jgi:hypothetical protein
MVFNVGQEKCVEDITEAQVFYITPSGAKVRQQGLVETTTITATETTPVNATAGSVKVWSNSSIEFIETTAEEDAGAKRDGPVETTTITATETTAENATAGSVKVWSNSSIEYNETTTESAVDVGAKRDGPVETTTNTATESYSIEPMVIYNVTWPVNSTDLQENTTADTQVQTGLIFRKIVDLET